MSEYTERAERFLSENQINLRATFKDNQSCPLWCDGQHIHGDQYTVTIYRTKEGKGKGSTDRFSFSFWNSLNDSQNGLTVGAYDVLAGMSSDAFTPETFSEFCSEYGYDEDSRKAYKTFKAADRLARRIRSFFTEEELEALAEIQ